MWVKQEQFRFGQRCVIFDFSQDSIREHSGVGAGVGKTVVIMEFIRNLATEHSAQHLYFGLNQIIQEGVAH
jgi:hypothetical protein